MLNLNIYKILRELQFLPSESVNRYVDTYVKIKSESWNLNGVERNEINEQL